MVEEDVVDELEAPVVKTPPSHQRKLWGINGILIGVIGKVTLDLELGTGTYSHEFYVRPKSVNLVHRSVDVTIGGDLLAKIGPYEVNLAIKS